VEVKIGVQHAPREINIESVQTADEVEKAVGDALAGFGQEVAGLAAIKQFCGKALFQPVDTPDHCGMIDRELLRRGGDRSAAHDRQHETKIVPIDRSSTLILHFRTSIVQYIALVSYKMQVKRICKAI